MSIELIVLDVDGTMTDTRITYSEEGDEIKSFNVKDGLAIASWRKLGKQVAIITGRNSTIVARRAKELHIEHFYQGIHNKKEVLETLLEKLDLSMDNVASIGDDLNDLKMLENAGLSFCPNDAVKYIANKVNVVCKKNGGDGVVREMIEYICEIEDRTEEFISLWE